MGLFRTPQDEVDFRHLQDRVAALEAEVARLAALISGGPAAGGTPVAGVPGAPPAPWLGDVRMLAVNGQKIQAIKLYREQTGVGLREAKDAVEALATRG